MIKYQIKKLSNGLTMIAAPMVETGAVNVSISIAAGSRYETKNQNGLAHFLEHMFFKGTKKRPTTLDIAKSLDGVGAVYNAFTSDEQTCFWVKAAYEHFDFALEILFDMLYNSKFDSAEITKEKGVIVEEINMYQDNPQQYVFDVAKELFYQEQPLGRSTAGTKETVRNLKRQNFVDFRDNFYTQQNMFVTVAGKIDPTKIFAKIEQYFGKNVKSDKNKFEKVLEAQTKPACKIHFKETDQAHLILGFRGLKRTDSNRPTLKVLNNILGDTMSSWLFTQVREKRGLAYYVGSDYFDFIDTGAICAIAGVDKNKTKEAIKVILEQFAKMKEGKILDEELSRAKENLEGKLYLGLEDSTSIASFLEEQQMFWGKIEQPEQVVKEMKNVSKSDIVNFSNQIFQTENLNLAMVAPFKNENEFINLLQI